MCRCLATPAMRESVSALRGAARERDICLKDFVRSVARSDAFRRHYWSGLYIVKAIEVMHRRLLGRPTFGRWEIDALFDTAARRGLWRGRCPHRRQGLPGLLWGGHRSLRALHHARRSQCAPRPTLEREVTEFGYDSSGLVLTNRPEPMAPSAYRGSGEITPRNFPGRGGGSRAGGTASRRTSVATTCRRAASDPTWGADQAEPHEDRSSALTNDASA